MKSGIIVRNLAYAIPAGMLVFIMYGILETWRLLSIGIHFGASPGSFAGKSILVYLILGVLAGAAFWLLDSVILAVLRKSAKFAGRWQGFSFYFLASSGFIFGMTLLLKLKMDWLIHFKKIPLIKAGTLPVFALVALAAYLGIRIFFARFLGNRALSFISRVFFPVLVTAYAVFLYGFVSPGAPEDALSDVPRVLMITIDTLRADYLGCGGMEEIRSPNIDSVANEGIHFEKAYSQAPYTWPSLTSILTGNYTVRHGVRMNFWKMEGNPVTIPGLLGRNGVSTAGISDIGLRDFGIEQDIDEIIERRRNMLELQPFRRILQFLPVFSGWFGPGSYSSLPTTLTADKWLIKNARKPAWFLWIHYYNDAPHGPYFSPEPYRSMYLDEEYSGDIDGSLKQIVEHTANRSSLPPEDVQALKALYMSEVTWLDKQIGVLLERLRKLDVYDETTIIINSDHGQMFGREGNYQHGFYLYESLLRVPLIIKSPVIPSYLAGSKINDLVRLIDIFPTIVEMYGIDEEAPSQCDGRSLLNFLKHGNDSDFKVWNYAETLRYAMHIRPVESDEINFGYCAVAHNGWKFIDVPGKGDSRLYNTEFDRDEVDDRLNFDEAVATALIDSVAAHFGVEKTVDLTPARSHEMSDRTRERLRTLGYLQ